ncbi:MAG: hypothetical protein KDB07_10095 [Planctomycetes bacterium]|nr:hypothetical protein [Planctomycetota bacterium]
MTSSPELVVSHQRGAVSLAVSNFLRSPDVEVRRIDLATNEVLNTWKVESFLEATEELADGGHWQYQLWVGEKLSQSADVDLRAKTRLEFVAATSERGFFRLKHASGIDDVVVRVGQSIEGLFATEQGGIRIVESQARLESLELKAGRQESDREVVLTRPDGTPELGLNGKPLIVKSRQVRVSDTKAALALVRIAEKVYEVREGSELELPLTLRVK